MLYLILAQVCSVVGAGVWWVALCYICFIVQLIASAIKTINAYKEKIQLTNPLQ